MKCLRSYVNDFSEPYFWRDELLGEGALNYKAAGEVLSLCSEGQATNEANHEDGHTGKSEKGVVRVGIPLWIGTCIVS